MELLTKVRELVKGKQASMLAGYTDAVRQVATGAKTDPEKVAQVLDAAGKTPEEFEADVTAFAERLRLRGVADKQADAEKKLAAGRAKIDQLEKKLEEAVIAIREEAAPVHDAVRKAEADLNAARDAENTLRKTYPADGPARAEFAEAQRRERSADAKRNELREMIKRAEGTIRLATESPNHYGRDTVPDAEKRLAAYREELATAEAERTAAVRDMESATARMVQP